MTVKPLVDLIAKKVGSGQGIAPTTSELTSALSLVGSDAVETREHSIRFRKPGMGITLDGIAKGYIVDMACKTLAAYQIENFLINAGGDIRTKGTRLDGRPWRVAIQDPEKGVAYPDVIQMYDGAVATSGNYEIYYDREKMFHHIVNPKDGRCSQVDASVSVTAATAIQSDALSTSVFVMEPLHGIRFIESIPGCECLLISREGRISKSAGWKSHPA
jgi:thiamine biosynthesis lipoprotein